MDFRKQRGTTKKKVAPEDLKGVRKTFLSDDIPGELIFNWTEFSSWCFMDYGQIR